MIETLDAIPFNRVVTGGDHQSARGPKSLDGEADGGRCRNAQIDHIASRRLQTAAGCGHQFGARRTRIAAQHNPHLTFGLRAQMGSPRGGIPFGDRWGHGDPNNAPGTRNRQHQGRISHDRNASIVACLLNCVLNELFRPPTPL